MIPLPLLLIALVGAIVIIVFDVRLQGVWTKDTRGFRVMAGPREVFAVIAVKQPNPTPFEEDDMKNKWQPPPQAALKQAMAKMDWTQKAQVMISAVAADLGVTIAAGVVNEKEKGYCVVLAPPAGETFTKESAALFMRQIGEQMIKDADRLAKNEGAPVPTAEEPKQ